MHPRGIPFDIPPKKWGNNYEYFFLSSIFGANF